MSSDIPWVLGFLGAATGNVDVSVIAAILGAIWVAIQIMDRLSPKSSPDLRILAEAQKGLTESQKVLTEEVKGLTGVVRTYMEVSKERHDTLLHEIRESRKNDH